MTGNLDFFSTKSGVKTRGMTSAADSEVSVVTSTLLSFSFLRFRCEDQDEIKLSNMFFSLDLFFGLCFNLVGGGG